MDLNLESYKTIVLYGIGQYYEKVKKELFRLIKPDYLCDRKWETDSCQSYDGIPIIKKEQLKTLDNVLVIMTVVSPFILESIRKELKNMGGIAGRLCDWKTATGSNW